MYAPEPERESPFNSIVLLATAGFVVPLLLYIGLVLMDDLNITGSEGFWGPTIIVYAFLPVLLIVIFIKYWYSKDQLPPTGF